jgi:hypothetical protein
MQNSHNPFSPPSSQNILVPSPVHHINSSTSSASKQRDGYVVKVPKKAYLTSGPDQEFRDRNHLPEFEKQDKTYFSDSSGNNTEDKGSQTLWSIPLDVALPNDVLSSGSLGHLERHAHKKFRHRRRELIQKSGDSDTQDEDQPGVSDQKLPKHLEKIRDRPHTNNKTNERKIHYRDNQNLNDSRLLHFEPCSPDSVEPRTPLSLEPRTPYSEPRTPYSDPRTPYSDPCTPYSEPRTPYTEPPGTPYNDSNPHYSEPSTPRTCSTPSTPASCRSSGPQTPYSVVNSPMVQSVEPHTPQSLDPPDSVSSKNSDESRTPITVCDGEPCIDLSMPKSVENCEPKTPYSEPRTPYVEPITPYSIQPGSHVVQLDDTEFDSGYSSKTDMSEYRASKGNVALIPREVFLAKAKTDDKNTIDLSNKNNLQMFGDSHDSVKHHTGEEHSKVIVASRQEPGPQEMISHWNPKENCDKSNSDSCRQYSVRAHVQMDNTKSRYNCGDPIENTRSQSMLSKEQQFERKHRNVDNWGNSGSPNNSVNSSIIPYGVEKCDERIMSKSDCDVNKDYDKPWSTYRMLGESPGSVGHRQQLEDCSSYQTLTLRSNLDNHNKFEELHPHPVRETINGENVGQSEETHPKEHVPEVPEASACSSQSGDITPFRPLIIDLDMASNSNKHSADVAGHPHLSRNEQTHAGCLQNGVSSAPMSRESSPHPSAPSGQKFQRQVSDPISLPSPQKRDHIQNHIQADYVMRSPPFIAPNLEPWGYDPNRCMNGAPGYFNGHYNQIVNNFNEYPSNPAIPRFIHPAMPSMVTPSSQASSVMGRPHNGGNFQNQIPPNLQQLPQEVPTEQFQYINDDILQNIKQEKMDDQNCCRSQCQVSMFPHNSPLIDSDRSLDSCDSSVRVVQRKRMSVDSNVDSSPNAKPKRTNYQKEIEKVSCQVCSDIASGFHCGAYVCEACKVSYNFKNRIPSSVAF